MQPKSLLILLILSTTQAAEINKPIAVTRTELKVSRSLDPSSMQTVNVVTKDGSVAQLIVKKRDGKSQLTTPAPAGNQENERILQEIASSSWIPIPAGSTFSNVQEGDINKNIGNQIADDESIDKSKVPRPVTITSENVFVKGQSDENKRGRSIVRVESDGIPVIHGVRVPDDASDTKVWRNARVINGELVPYEQNYVPQRAIPEEELTVNSNQENSYKNIGVGPFTTSDNYPRPETSRPSIGPFTVNDNRHYPSEYFNSQNSYVRFASDSGIGPFTKADNARIANSKLIDYIKQINEQESKRDYFSGRKSDLEAVDSRQIQRRMLYYGGNYNYPNSLLYTPQSTKLSRVNFNDGVRTPVLQYAHPELGVQPAKVSTENEEYKPEKERNIYYTNLPSERVYTDQSNPNYLNSGRNSDRPNKYYDDYYRKKDVTHTPYYRIKANTEAPFWIKIGDSIRDNVQTGLAKMQQFTRPVLDPIVEATHKIGHNLGLTRMPPEIQAQDKIGVGPPAIGSSVILPALGLVAGGAALGFGAAAMGRLLDIGNMRSNEGDKLIDNLEMQHKRALESYGNHENIILVMHDDKDQKRADSDSGSRTRRSVNEQEDDKYFDHLMQSVEADLQSKSLGGHLAGNVGWADTPCAKRMFCDVMIKQSYEEILFMEKKMDSFLSMVHPVIVNSVSHHLHDVMSAVRSHDCSRFTCPSTHSENTPSK